LGHIERVISIAPVGVLAFPVVTGVNLVVTVSSVQFLYTLSCTAASVDDVGITPEVLVKSIFPVLVVAEEVLVCTYC